MNRLFLKIVSLVISLGLWLYVNLGVNPVVTRHFKVRVSLVGPTELKEISVLPDVVTVSLKGKRTSLLALNAMDLKAYVETLTYKESEGLVKNVKVSVVTPPGFTMVDFRPRLVDLNIVRLFRRDYFLETKIRGEPREGFLVDRVEARQIDYVTVLGVKPHLGRVDKVVAEIDVAGRSENFVASFPLALLDKQDGPVDIFAFGLKFNPAVAEIAVTFKEGYPRRSVPLKMQFTGALPPGLRLEKEVELRNKNGELVSALEIEGPNRILKTVDQVPVGPLDLSQVALSQERPVQARIPAGLSAVKQQELVAHLTVEEEVQDRVLPSVPVICMNTDPERLLYRVEPDRVELHIRGRISELDRILLASEPLRVDVDKKGARSEPYPMRLWFPTTLVRVKKIVPPQVSVTISSVEKIASGGIPLKKDP